MNDKQTIEVVAGIIFDSTRNVLLSKRPKHLHQGGLWEFPGGKVEAGESHFDALKRELLEELDVSIDSAEPFLDQLYDYPEKTVRLFFFEVNSWRGEPRGMEGQEIRWVAPEKLQGFEFPAANTAVVKALS
ncbi:MAG: 8-oxo-dGTP diphosphatase MutT [Pseudomonadota bacterium]